MRNTVFCITFVAKLLNIMSILTPTTPTSDQTLRRYTYAGYMVLVALFVMALWFYKERIIYVDLAFHTLYMMRDNFFIIPNNRFCTVTTQWLPLLLMNLKVPLKWVLMTYSAMFVLWSVFTYWFINQKLGLKHFSYVVILYLTLMATHTFYWTQSEFLQGAMYHLLLWALVLYWQTISIKDWGKWLILAIFATTASFSHPMMLTPMLFCVGWFAWAHKSYNVDIKAVVFIGVLTILLYLVKNKLMTIPEYDKQSMGMVFGGLRKNWRFFFHLPSHKQFVNHYLNDYYLIPISLCFLAWFYLRQNWREKLKFAYILAATFAVYFVVTCGYGVEASQAYVENLYMPISLFIAIPLALDVLPQYAQKSWAIGIVIVLLSVRLFNIYHEHRPYTTHSEYMQNLIGQIENKPCSKWILSKNKTNKDKLIYSWGSAYETLLLSALKDPNKCKQIVILDNPDKLDWTLSNNHAVFTEFEALEYKQLPTYYFNFTDTCRYQKW